MTASPLAPLPRLSTLPAAILFDMDGLMLDTEPLAMQAWADAAQALGVAFDASVCPRLIGRNFKDCEQLLREHHGADFPVQHLMRRWGEAYDVISARQGVALKDGLVPLLDWLEAARIPAAVATSTRAARARVKLEKAALAHRFVVVVGGDEVAHGKPAPDIYLEAAARMAAAPATCLVLEDSEPGVLAALAAGMPAIMVPDLVPVPQALAERGLAVMASLHAVRHWLSRLAPRARPGMR